INTEFVNSVRSVSDLAAYAPPYDEIVQKYMGASTNVFAQYGQTGADIAEVILAAATAETPDFRYITSDFAKQVVAPKVVDPTGNSVVSAFAARLQ
nr:hypothetical protein [Phenylobacterium sp.]